MITYSTKSNTELQVKLEGKIVGTIKLVEGGYQYFPKGKKIGGEVFTTLYACKKSLEDQ